MRHIASCLKVGHAFCSSSQYAQVVHYAANIGLRAICRPMLYVADSSNSKRLNVHAKPQDIVEYAAVSIRLAAANSEKHNISMKRTYANSVTPSYSNVVCNVFPTRSRLSNSDGKPFDTSERSKELHKYILRQWCRPGGLWSNLNATTIAVGLAVHDVGIRYVPV